MPSAIEQHFPSKELSVLAELESWRKEINRPTYHMHKWWATRLGSVFRAILIGALSNDKVDIWDNFYQNIDFSDKVVFDPFMGAGTTIGEALKLGCTAIGADINPVSVFQVRKALEPIRVDDLFSAFARVESKVKNQIKEMYRSVDPDTNLSADILYSFWVMNTLCPNCHVSVDLFDTSIFAKHAYPAKVPLARSVCFHCGYINTTRYDATRLSCSRCDRVYDPQKGVTEKGNATCLHCGVTFKIADAVSETEEIPKYTLYALLILTSENEKKYIQATEMDKMKLQQAKERLKSHPLPLPVIAIEPGHNTNQILRYNFKEWKQLFNDRQLYCLSLLLQAILEEDDERSRELLLLLFSGTLEFNNMFCSYKGEGTGAVRHLFNHHILKPEKMALENSVWGTHKSSGCFSTLFETRLLSALRYRQQPFELSVIQENGKNKGRKIQGLSSQPICHPVQHFAEVNKKNRALLFCTDSAHVSLPDESVDAIVTDPPYFDFVHYSELADFFYSWLQLGLKDKYPEFNKRTTRHSQEVQQKEAQLFSEALSRVFVECKRVLKAAGVLVFSFHHSRSDGWAAVGEAILNAGLSVVAVHPIKAEMASAAPKSQTDFPINYDAIVVCRRQVEISPLSHSDALKITLENVKRKISAMSAIGEKSKLSRGDIFVIAQAEALCTFSRHAGSLSDSSGADVTLLAFLRFIASQLCTLESSITEIVADKTDLVPEADTSLPKKEAARI